MECQQIILSRLVLDVWFSTPVSVVLVRGALRLVGTAGCLMLVLGLAHYWVLNQRTEGSLLGGLSLWVRFLPAGDHVSARCGWCVVLVGVVVWELHSGREHLAGHQHVC